MLSKVDNKSYCIVLYCIAVIDLPEKRDLSKSESNLQTSALPLLQETVVKWLAAFTQASKKHDANVPK